VRCLGLLIHAEWGLSHSYRGGAWLSAAIRAEPRSVG
jgi:hypothetical protein